MADPRFFKVAGPFSLGELAEISVAKPAAAYETSRLFRDVSPLETAGPEDVSFLDNKKYVSAFQASKAGLCVVAPDMVDKAPPGMALLVSPDPYRSYARIAQSFYPVAAPEAWVPAQRFRLPNQPTRTPQHCPAARRGQMPGTQLI